MATSLIFDYEINNFDDVRDHLDALWTEFNELVGALNSLSQCSDPPNTCDAESPSQNSKQQPKKGGAYTKPTRQAK